MGYPDDLHIDFLSLGLLFGVFDLFGGFPLALFQEFGLSLDSGHHSVVKLFPEYKVTGVGLVDVVGVFDELLLATGALFGLFFLEYLWHRSDFCSLDH